jgi:hypothetical protein
MVRKIDFKKIKEAQLVEKESLEDISIRVLLIVDKSSNSGASRQEEIILTDVTWNPHPPAPSPIKGEGE